MNDKTLKAGLSECSELLGLLRDYASDWRKRAASKSPVEKAIAEIERLRGALEIILAAIVRADLQIGDGHIREARRTLDDAMDAPNAKLCGD